MEQNKNKEKAIPNPDTGNKDSTIMPKEKTGELLQSGIIIPVNKELDLDEVVKEANVVIGPPPEKREESTPKRDSELESSLKELDEVSGNVPKKQEEVAGNILPKTPETDTKTEAALPQKIDEGDQAITESEELPKIGKEEQQELVTEASTAIKITQQTQDDKNQKNNNFQEPQTQGAMEAPTGQAQTNPTKDEVLGNVPKKQEEVVGNTLPKTPETDTKAEATLPQKIDEGDQAITEPEELPKIGKEEQQEPATEAATTKVTQQAQDDKNQENNNFQEPQTRGVIEAPVRQTQTNPMKNARFGVMYRGNMRFLAAEVYDSSGQKRYYRVARSGRRVAYRMMNSRALEERSKGGGGFSFEAFSNINQQTNNPTQPVKSRTGGHSARLQANVQVNGEDAIGTQAESSQSLAATSSIRFGQDSSSDTSTMQVKIAPGSKFRIDLENNTIEAI